MRAKEDEYIALYTNHKSLQPWDLSWLFALTPNAQRPWNSS
jgi:hypothetical protein